MIGFVPSAEDIGWLLLVYLVIPIAWIVGLVIFRSRPLKMALWSFAVSSFYIGWVALIRGDNYTLIIQFLDPDKRPVPNLSVDYFTHPQSDRLGRFAHVIKGQANTDATGYVILHPNHAHGISLSIRDRRFQNAGFHIEAAGKRYGHQMFPSDSVTFIEPPEPPPTTGPFHDTWVFDPQAQHRIVVALKSK